MSDAVLIDDNAFERGSWEEAARTHGKSILTFAGLQQFLEDAAHIDRSTPIFIDVELSGELNGINVAELISHIGFENLYLSTSHDLDLLSVPVGLVKGVIKKDPPSWLFGNLNPASRKLTEQDRNKLLAAMSSEQKETFKMRMKEFYNQLYDVGGFSFLEAPIGRPPQDVFDAWEFAIFHSYSDEDLQRTIRDAWPRYG